MLDFHPVSEFLGRQLRLPSSLLEDDFIDPYTFAQDATHELRRSEAVRMSAAHGCVVAADRRALSTASHSRQRKPQRVLVAGEPVFKHRRKDGTHGWCGPGVCVLSEEVKPGRNETVWVHMRNCLPKCNRTQVRPATNEEAERIETVTPPLQNLFEAVREGRTRHFADITDEGDPEDYEPMVVEGDVMDVPLGRTDSQREPEELNTPANSNARSEPHAEPEAEASTSAGTDMETGVNDRKVQFRGERVPETPFGRILGSRVWQRDSAPIQIPSRHRRCAHFPGFPVIVRHTATVSKLPQPVVAFPELCGRSFCPRAASLLVRAIVFTLSGLSSASVMKNRAVHNDVGAAA